MKTPDEILASITDLAHRTAQLLETAQADLALIRARASKLEDAPELAVTPSNVRAAVSQVPLQWASCTEHLSYADQEELCGCPLLLGHWDGQRWTHLWMGSAERVERDARNIEFDDLVLGSRAEWQEWPPVRIVATHYLLIDDLPRPEGALPKASSSPFRCWHCHDHLLQSRPCCEHCPEDCDLEGCQAPGCLQDDERSAQDV